MQSSASGTAAYVVSVTYRCRPGTGPQVADLLRQMVEPSRAEPGCLLYEASTSVDDPDVLFLYEQYVDEAAYEAHRASPHFKEIVEAQAIPRLLDRERRFSTTLA